MAQQDPLDFWSALNGQSTTDYTRTQRDINTGNDITSLQQTLDNAEKRYDQVGTSSPDSAQAYRDVQAAKAALAAKQNSNNYTPYQDLAQDEAAQASDASSRIDPYTQAINQQSGLNNTSRQQWQDATGSAFQSATAGNAGLFQGLDAGRQNANANDAQTIGRYTDAVDSANATSAQGYQQLQDAYGNYGVLQANPYQGDAQSNPEDIARQQGAYDQLGGWASGANDISSDPGLVGMQQSVYDDYGQFASGAMDLQSQAATAAADPEAVAAQKEALGEFRDRMDPKLTDAERYMYMQSRLAQEQSQRAVRDANYRELERRGMGGSTMALSNLNASSAEASNTRALQDLGANAKAVDRAERALVNYGNMSSTMREQSFTEDYATKSAADKMAINNNQQRLAGIAGQGAEANAMRSADDAMRTGNANRQLAGAQSQGEMATSMRNAGDAMNMFNKEQQGIQLRHQDDFNAGQQRDAWTRDAGMFDASQSTANGLSTREGALANSKLQQSDAQFGRLQGETNTGVGMNKDYVSGMQGLSGQAGQDRRDSMTELGAGSDSEFRATQLAQAGQHDVNTTREKIIDQQGEDRRAAGAVSAAQSLQNDQQAAEDRNRNVWDKIF